MITLLLWTRYLLLALVAALAASLVWAQMSRDDER
jgi:hypothetical protein